jgi:hypothetical protein
LQGLSSPPPLTPHPRPPSGKPLLLDSSGWKREREKDREREREKERGRRGRGKLRGREKEMETGEEENTLWRLQLPSLRFRS